MRTCTLDRCDKPHQARGLCKTHYNQTLPGRHVRREIDCTVCGTKVTKMTSGTRTYGQVCSNECRRRLQFGWSEPLPDDHWARWYGTTCEWPPSQPKPERATWACGICTDCGAPFTKANDGLRTQYCSMRCLRRVGKRIRRAREHKAAGTYRYVEVMRLFMASGKRCAYCDQPIDGVPDPEHVLPLSRGGRNDITNLVAACRTCNTDKRDLTLNEWAADRAARGLPTVNTDTSGRVFRHLVLRPPSGPPHRQPSRLPMVLAGSQTPPGTP